MTKPICSSNEAKVRNAAAQANIMAIGKPNVADSLFQKITKRLSINAEYYYQLPGHKITGTTNSLSTGIDIETGGHVFQLHFTNSQGMSERSFITETNGDWGKGDVYFGFNISRVFTLGSNKRTHHK